MKKPGANGFTLMEVMITVVIVGILATIAYPNYTQYVQTTRRTDATKYLVEAAARQVKFSNNCNGVYTNRFGGSYNACTGLGMDPVVNGTSYTTPDGGHYILTVTVLLPGPPPLNTPGGGGFTLSSSPNPLSPQFASDNAKCTTITITDAGVKGATGTDSLLGPFGGKCWKK